MRAALLLLLLAALAGCGGETSEGGAPGPQTGSAPGSPRVAGESLEGEPVSLDDFRGRPVFVNVWSSW